MNKVWRNFKSVEFIRFAMAYMRASDKKKDATNGHHSRTHDFTCPVQKKQHIYKPRNSIPIPQRKIALEITIKGR
jgi:hypothetical protein